MKYHRLNNVINKKLFNGSYHFDNCGSFESIRPGITFDKMKINHTKPKESRPKKSVRPRKIKAFWEVPIIS